MFKQICLVLVLVLALAVGSVTAAENEQECTLKQGMKVIQMMPNAAMRGVMTAEETPIMIGPELNDVMVNNLSSQSGMDWTGGNMGIIQVDFGQGPMPIMIIVKESDVKDCK